MKNRLWGVGVCLMAVGVIALVAAPGQGEGTNDKKPHSGVRGVAVQGPISPVEQVGEPNTAPLPGAIITVQPEGGGNEIARTAANDKGRFSMRLAPGTYLIVPLPPDSGSILPHGEPQTVTVVQKKFTEVIVHYDTGIR
jgi:hypothetical protein